jgi:hypothetical protein
VFRLRPAALSLRSLSRHLRLVHGALLFVFLLSVSVNPAIGQTPEEDSLQVKRASSLAVPFPLPSKHAIGPILTDTVEARRFDNGKMWTFDAPPAAYFQEAYDVDPDSTWFRRARLGTLRIPGCTASFASSHGLMLTNHHCARDHVTAVSNPGEQLLQNGFYAPSLTDERAVPNLYADQLIAIEDVTTRVESAMAEAQTDAERAEARQAAIETIQQSIAEQRGGTGAGIQVEVIPLYNGARYSAYVFRRYEDVRLVMVPELQLGYFGGDTDNFTYPRFALDMALFRVYDDGEPLQTEYYFPWAQEGSQQGDPVFVVGNPGSTLRLETVSQLMFRRDVREPALLDFLRSRAEALQAYIDEAEEPSEELENTIFGLQNGAKLYRGRVRALKDPYVIARRQDAEDDFQDAITTTPAYQEAYGGLIDSMAAIQAQKRDYADAYQAFLLLGNPSYSSATLQRALLAQQYLSRQSQGASGEQLQPLRQQMERIGTQPTAVDRRFLAARLRDVQTYFGDDHAIVQEALHEQAPDAVAQQIITNSVLADSAQFAQALESGTLSNDDPALQLVEAFRPRYQEFQSAWAGLTAREQDVARQLGQARFAIYGTDIPPDASFALRIADGVVRTYEYNGTIAPPYTTFYGLYEHFAMHGPDSEWALPERWQNPPDEFNRATPLNLVSTNDITGGNSGSPLLNADLEVVGLIFDGNIESLAGDYIYMPDQGMRTVSVDVRGMLEALDVMYDADRLVLEVTEQAFVESESAADATATSAQ